MLERVLTAPDAGFSAKVSPHLVLGRTERRSWCWAAT